MTGRAAGGLGETYRRLSPWLERRLTATLGAFIDVEDVVQESFVRLGRYEGDSVRHPKALLLRIASNLVMDAKRRSARRGVVHLPLEEARDVVAPVGDPADLLDLKTAIMGLPPKLRDTLLLARFTPLTNEEIAERLGVSTKTVEWRISRALSICLARLVR